ncbi:flagellar assembly peptidoglycan hydrolase FlgJ [Herbaspirillum huttiense F1]|jgi:flagellar protein FlgJ|uniref:Peptidoglycan hydrolase FlgJ n=1 Tax=Herbaspirillum huttiense subsp. lycopersici TaxID=3074428 RepID=A0ABU2EFI4_9BURK|nr:MULTISPECIES: flagellar assembly peptidoglycan hydrolase FlgJ [Herbaspirillum]MAF01641.1 flagellar assembly peptidoglycan hydrolase FlgJ [Herbaspirillum sp.]MBO18397.1 flagellar assembly peptidoglycan hydrolase FlgJ [Herbaspirillum sp.]MBP1312959.1 flagellar protein FlgJ [Herbaspirillum sp. 1130]MDR6738195.1 flagellar protein FlgJ [Herbaspirillum sp. 1173]MDR9846891.1 flagellar assembly peptidoglycan hydrolase FlgJ [Herbaspirillum huttiense SE1]|tara:strand:+ start:355 stop:1326 length:972 start_codon:yes stop_codon:yes gene_type:complete
MLNKINPSNPTEGLAVDANGLNGLREAAKQNTPESVKGAAKQFEALFLNMVMKSMRDATPQNGPFDNEQTKMFTSMLDQQLSQSLAQRGVGLADVLTRQLSASLPKKLPDAQDLEGNPLPGEEGLPMGIPLVKDMSDADRAKFIQSFASQQAAESTDQDGRNKQRRNSNKPAHVEAFQNRLQADAEMASKMTGIPAKFMLAQAALETGWGKKEIVTRDGRSAHNLFGIKATGNWTGKVVEATTIEYINGKPQKRVEKFRAYDSYADAFKDYANLLRSNPRYEKVLASAQDAHGFAYGLQRAGYATDPHYAEKLSRIIRQSLSA